MRALGAALLAVTLAWPMTAGAQPGQPQPEQQPAPSDPSVEARVLFERGVALSREERWGEALEYFRRSRSLVDRPSTAFNAAVALLRLGRPTEAASVLDEYMRMSEDDARETARRAEAEELRALAASTIAELALGVTPENAVVRIDGTELPGQGDARVLALDPGTHSVEVTAEGYQPTRFEIALLESEHASRVVALEPIPAPTGPAHARIVASVASATISIDGEEAGRGRWEGELAPGTRRIEVRAEGYATYRQTTEVEPEGRIDLRATLEPLETTSIIGSPWLWIAVGVVVAAGVGVGVGVAATSGPGDPYGGTTGVVLQGLSR